MAEDAEQPPWALGPPASLAILLCIPIQLCPAVPSRSSGSAPGLQQELVTRLGRAGLGTGMDSRAMAWGQDQRAVPRGRTA